MPLFAVPDLDDLDEDDDLGKGIDLSAFDQSAQLELRFERDGMFGARILLDLVALGVITLAEGDRAKLEVVCRDCMWDESERLYTIAAHNLRRPTGNALRDHAQIFLAPYLESVRPLDPKESP